jgi:hypothetical protein
MEAIKRARHCRMDGRNRGGERGTDAGGAGEAARRIGGKGTDGVGVAVAANSVGKFRGEIAGQGGGAGDRKQRRSGAPGSAATAKFKIGVPLAVLSVRSPFTVSDPPTAPRPCCGLRTTVGRIARGAPHHRRRRSIRGDAVFEGATPRPRRLRLLHQPESEQGTSVAFRRH